MSHALQAALRTAAFSPIQNLGWLRVTGADRVRWLNGMVTNSIQALAPGEGCYNFVLNAQGRIQADCTAWLEPESILLETVDPAALAALLDRFIIMDDVELEVLGPPGVHQGLHLIGPDATATLSSLGLPTPEPLHLVRSGNLTVLHTHSSLVPRFEIWAPEGKLPPLAPPELTPEDLLALRLLEGTPLVGADIRERDLPQETGQTRALHFSKGCYLGQEIVERIRSRGQVHRALQGFVLAGEVPDLPATLELDGKAVGELTSAAVIPLEPPVRLGLGIVRREAVERAGASLTYAGGTASPVPLPYTLR